MSYVPRIEVPQGYYHVGTRGISKRAIFVDEDDRWTFLLIVRHVAAKYGWTLYAHCLMGNHYHLVLQIGEAGLSNGMCELNTAYATTFNARHGRENHLFGRRFWDERIESDRQLLETCRYVVLNPCRAGMCRSPADWVWSSYLATIGQALVFPRLTTGLLLERFDRVRTSAVCEFVAYCGERPGGHVRRQPP